MSTKPERVAIQEQKGKGCFAATQSVGKTKKERQELLDTVETEVVEETFGG